MDGSDRTEVLHLLHRRAALLARLDDEPAEKPELADSLEYSRSTVDRAIRELETRELETRELVRRGTAGYETTLAGRLVRQEYETALAGLDDTMAAAEVLEHLPPDVPLSVAYLRDAEVHRPTPPAPRAPLDRLRELISSANRYCGFTTAVLVPGFLEQVRALMERGELELELVYSEQMASYISEEYTDELRQSLQGGNHRMFVVDEVPYGFGLLYGEGTWTYLVAEGPDGGFRGLLLNDTDAAVEWAEALYERYRTRAREVTDV